MDPIQFVDDSTNTALADAIADYQAIAGRVVGNADPEMLQITAFAYRLAKERTSINNVANQNLIAFATGAALEQLGAKFGIYRLEATPATVILQFNMNSAQTFTIPAGTQIKSADGAVIFATDSEIDVTGQLAVMVSATCQTAGTIGNNYAIGTINVIVEPIAYVTSALNTEVTSGGSDDETDDQLRERIPLANSTFSVAGPKAAYEYFAKSANPAIVDVSVNSPVPGTVNIYPILASGQIPGTSVLDEVAAICNDEKVRPLTDTVNVVAPTEIDYDISVQLTLKSNTVGADIQAQVESNLNGYVNQWDENILGKDIILDQIIGLCMVTGVYSCEIDNPLIDILCDDTEFANCLSITVTIAGTVDEL